MTTGTTRAIRATASTAPGHRTKAGGRWSWGKADGVMPRAAHTVCGPVVSMLGSRACRIRWAIRVASRAGRGDSSTRR
ncbi:hypothetical protein [Streptomyces sp. enrichment culture]|uniref:hypothetical protein n=1 Tax=Streptomyces sp. enrichment culture TaxID=1795815 RepID=UPI003F548965